MQVIESSSTDAARNAAIEESVFRRPEISEPVLMLYRNSETVLFGRNQNPWAECDVAHCLEEDVVLLRRLSGGGTLEMTTEGWSPEAVYVKAAYLNGKRLEKPEIRYEDIKDGARLHFVMGKRPVKRCYSFK